MPDSLVAAEPRRQNKRRPSVDMAREGIRQKKKSPKLHGKGDLPFHTHQESIRFLSSQESAYVKAASQTK